MGDETYYAWIPTASGRLSFSVATTVSIGEDIFQYADVARGGTHFIAAVRWDTSDFTVPFISGSRRLRGFFERLLTGNETRFIFLCQFGISVDFESLSGEVAVVPHRLWEEHQVELEGRLGASAAEADRGQYRRLGVMSDLPGSICVAHFQIARNGVCEIAIQDTAPEAHASLEESGQVPEEAFSSFIYYFLRELFHTHKYHSPDSDSIITAYNGDWRSKVCASLLRKIIVLRKMGDIDSLRRAMGILTYVESFMANVLAAGDKLYSPRSVETLREALRSDIEIAQSKNTVTIARRVSGWVKVGAGALIALVAYLRINYDLVSAVFEDNIARLNGIDPLLVQRTTLDKSFLVDFYLRYTDEFVITSAVLFILSSILSWDVSFIRSAVRDMLRYAVIQRELVIFITAALAILCLGASVYFVIEAY